MGKSGEGDRPRLSDVLRSVAAAFIGVQSERNRERDFSQGKPIHFILVGLVATALFVLTLWLLVRLILHFAGV